MKADSEARQLTIHHVAEPRGFFQSNTAEMALSIPWIPIFLIALTLIHLYFSVLICGLVGSFWQLKQAVAADSGA